MKNTRPYSDYVWNKIEPIKKLIDDLWSMPPGRIDKVRRKLGDYAFMLPNDKKVYVQAVIYLIKKKHNIKDLESNNDRRWHILSDHAFIRALERLYSCDIKKIKDLVLLDIQRSGLEQVISQTDARTILTVLKKVK